MTTSTLRTAKRVTFVPCGHARDGSADRNAVGVGECEDVIIGQWRSVERCVRVDVRDVEGAVRGLEDVVVVVVLEEEEEGRVRRYGTKMCKSSMMRVEMGRWVLLCRDGLKRYSGIEWRVWRRAGQLVGRKTWTWSKEDFMQVLIWAFRLGLFRSFPPAAWREVVMWSRRIWVRRGMWKCERGSMMMMALFLPLKGTEASVEGRMARVVIR